MGFRKILRLKPSIHEATQQYIRENSYVENLEPLIEVCESFAELHRRIEAVVQSVEQRTYGKTAGIEPDNAPLNRLLIPKERLNLALVKSGEHMSVKDLSHIVDSTKGLEKCTPVIDRLLYQAFEAVKTGDLNVERAAQMEKRIDELMESRIRFDGKPPEYLSYEYAQLMNKEWQVPKGHQTWIEYCKGLEPNRRAKS